MDDDAHGELNVRLLPDLADNAFRNGGGAGADYGTRGRSAHEDVRSDAAGTVLGVLEQAAAEADEAEDERDRSLARQLILDDVGNILTDARYSEWRSYDNVRFPKHIEINRPRDEYGVVIDVVKMDINKGVSDDKFVLNQPEGSIRQVVGEPANADRAPKEPGK
jgi:hypothetical protein